MDTNTHNSQPFGLTLTQQDIYFDQLYHPKSPIYNIGGYIELGKINPASLNQAHQFLVGRFDAFGIRVVNRQQRLEQYITTERTVELPLLDFSERDDPQASADQWLADRFTEAFTIDDSELFCSYLLRLADNSYRYVGLAHHLVMDGWGFAQWAKVLGQYYNAIERGEGLDEQVLPQTSWHEVVELSEAYQNSKNFDKSREYWRQQIAALSPSFFTRRNQTTSGPEVTVASGRKTLSLPIALHQQLVQVADEFAVSVAQVYLAVVAIYFSRVCSRDSVTIGIPAHNRSNHRQKQMIGVFTSVSPLSLAVDKEVTIAEFCQALSRRQQQNYRHQRFPFGEIKRLSDSADRLYDIGFNYLNLDSELLIEGQSAPLVYLSHRHEQTPLMLTVWEYGRDRDIVLKLDHNLAYLNEQEAADIGERLLAMLEQLATDKAQQTSLKVKSLQPYGRGEFNRLMQYATAPITPRSALGIHQRFEQQAEAHPDNIALQWLQQSLSYNELNQQANRLARALREQGVETGDRIGVKMRRSPDMVVAVLAVLKAGAAYVALDPAYPEARLNYIAQDSQMKLVLVDALSNKAQNNQMAVADARAFASFDASDLGLEVCDQQLAYLLYTSGSTGDPKGVMVTHQNVGALVSWATTHFGSDELSKVLASTSLNFDLSVFEMFVPLCSGHQIVLVEGILDLLQQPLEVSLINTVPMAMKVLVEQRALPQNVKTIVLAGEPLPGPLVNQLLEQGYCKKVVNGYGPTEDTVYSTFAEFTQPVDFIPPIGRPIDNGFALVLSDDLMILPMGVEGELCLGGAGVSNGYCNLPQLTEQSFIDNPFGEGRLYRTGDIVRLDHNGELLYIGRRDEQVKIRGFRVELSEIQWHLQHLEGVIDALVINTPERLVAFVIAQQDWRDANVLSQALAKVLPPFMVPNNLLFVDQWPLTPNGKVDKKSLLRHLGEQQGQRQKPLADGTQQKLAMLWRERLSLGANAIDSDSNFFQLGGHSLDAVQLCVDIAEQFHVDMAISDIFAHNTLAQLAQYIDSADHIQSLQPIEKIDRAGPLPVSFAQQRLWFIDRLEGQSAHYNMPLALDVEPGLAVDVLQLALNQLLLRHSVLRSNFVEFKGVTTLRMNQAEKVPLQLIDLTTEPQQQQLEATAALTHNEVIKPFDLTHELLIRACYIKCSDPLSDRLILNMHHICADGWSVEILLDELQQFYAAALKAQEIALAPLPIEYVDYAHWQRERMVGPVLQQQLAYWSKTLAELPLQHNLPLDHVRPTVKEYQGEVVYSRLSAKTVARLEQFAQAQQMTLFMLLHAALSLVLSRHSGEQDIVVGTPVACRVRPQLRPVVGFFANTLVLRVDTAKTLLSDFLYTVRQTNTDALAHQELPFEKLVEHFKLAGSRQISPLFQILFSLNSASQSAFELGDSRLSEVRLPSQLAKFDLDITAQHCEQGIEFSWVYDLSIFSGGHIEQLARHVCRTLEYLAEVIADKPQAEIEQLPLAQWEMLDDDEKNHLLFELNDTAKDYERHAQLYHWFENIASGNAGEIALFCQQQQITYAQLNCRANRLANYLRHCGITVGQPVGVCFNRNIDMVVAILGVLKAGGAYVPLDPQYPTQRLDFIIADSDMQLLLSEEALVDGVIDHLTLPPALDVVFCDAPQLMAYLDTLDCGAPKPLAGQNDKALAYIIYTSGTTGHPKGVMVTHGNAVALLAWAIRSYSREQLSGVLASTSICFDLSVFELFAPLSVGGCAIIVDSALALVDLQSHIASWPVSPTLINTVPSAIGALLSAQAIPTTVETVNLAGEPLSSDLVDRLYQAGIAKVYDLYGPSEDTTYSTYTLRQPNQPASIGRPIDNTQVYVVDAQLQLVPKGCVGELLIGGAGLTPGYLNRAELTEQKFIANPFIQPGRQDQPLRVYRTGDLVRWQADGRLGYIGRMDQQVKVHGFRIELDEIELALQQQHAVEQCLVMVRQSYDHDAYLAAYVVLKDKRELCDEDKRRQIALGLQQALARLLPQYMVPRTITLLEKMPLNANGKIDKKALPLPLLTGFEHQFVEPESAGQKHLAQIWQQLLSVERVGLEDNFFLSGGHSLLMAQLLSAIEQHFGCQMRLKDIYENPTLGAMAQHIERLCGDQGSSSTRIAPVARSEQGHELSFAQQRLWLVTQLDSGQASYNMPAIYQIDGAFDAQLAEQALGMIVARHEILRTAFVAVDGSPRQQVMPNRSFSLTTSTIECQAGQPMTSVIETIGAKLREQQFNLSGDNLMTVEYIEITPSADGATQPLDNHSGFLAFNIHHIIFDGWSVNLLMAEFVHYYTGLCRGELTPLAAPSIQYIDFVAWQRALLDSQVRKAHLDYWRELLHDAPDCHRLPLTQSRVNAGNRGHLHRQTLTAETLEPVRRLLQHHQATLFMFLQSSFALHIGRLSNEQDIVLGAPIAGRDHYQLDELIGLFINTQVFRSQFTAKTSFDELLAATKAQHLASADHNQLPFELLVDDINPPRVSGQSPLFQIMINYNNAKAQQLALGDCQLARVSTLASEPAKFDITLYIEDNPQGGIDLNWHYNGCLFSASQIALYAEEYRHLIERLAAQPEAAVLSHPWRTVAAVPKRSEQSAQSLVSCYGMIAAHAATKPDAPAITYGDVQWSWQTLTEQVDRLANYLASMGANKQSRLAIRMHRDLSRVVAILAVFKIGGCYVPLSSELPLERIRFMLEDSQADFLLSDEHSDSDSLLSADNNHCQVVMLDSPLVHAAIEQVTTSVGSAPVYCDDPAHIVYTSGSSGRPKGVIGNYGATVNRIQWMLDNFAFSDNERSIHVTSMAFIRGVWELLVPLCGGCELVLCDRDTVKQSDLLSQFIVKQRITRLVTAPSLMKSLCEQAQGFAAKWPLRYWFVSGEPLLQKDAQKVSQTFPQTALYNLYGSTEVMSDVLYRRVEKDASYDWVGLGQAIDGVEVYIVSPFKQLVPDGVIGQILVVGKALSNGYLNSAAADSSRSPFVQTPMGRGYLTGDLGVKTADGDIHYLGRQDGQVKLLGHRLEVAEVIAQLVQCDGVRQATALVRDEMLLAYVVAAKDIDHQAQRQLKRQIIARLRQWLPSYMVPAVITFIPQMPLKPNGKIDKAKLPAVEQLADQIKPPTNARQQALVALWSEVLKRQPSSICVEGDFFSQGGNSLLVTNVLQRLQSDFSFTISYQDFFHHSSIQRIDEQINLAQSAKLVVGKAKPASQKLVL